MSRLFAAIVAALCLLEAAHAETQWEVASSEGLDALLFVGVLTGDELQSRQYPEEIERYKTRLTDDERDALERLRAYYAEPGRGLAGPAFAYHFSQVADLSYEGVGAALANPQPVLDDIEKPLTSFEGPREEVLQRIADYRLVYEALDRIGFTDHWRKDIKPVIDKKTAEFQRFLAPYDIISIQEPILGRDLENRVQVFLLHYNLPYGIRIIGQRFIAYHEWEKESTLRVAIHEIFHPPFNDSDQALIDASSRLREAPLIQSIIANSNPRYGYSAFDSILDEDSTQALDMLVSLTLGVDRDPREYWRKQDEGMHLFAAAVFDALTETKYMESGVVYQDWLIDALSGDILSPEAVERRARKTVGDDAVDKWLPQAR